MILSLLFLILAIGCYSISQLQQHGKLKWMSKDPYGFWGEKSHKRKYKYYDVGTEERWPTSTNLTVFVTDGYHLCQYMFFNFLSLSVTFALGFNWWLLLGVWSLIHATHFILYKLLSKQP